MAICLYVFMYIVINKDVVCSFEKLPTCDVSSHSIAAEKNLVSSSVYFFFYGSSSVYVND
jgi:hypothetical protein